MIQEIQGDIIERGNEFDMIACTTNGIVKADGSLVMGAGIAKQFANHFPQLPMDWGRRTVALRRDYGQPNKPFVLYTPTTTGPHLISFPTKYDWRERADMVLIVDSFQVIRVVVDALTISSVLLPRPGCGMGGLSWWNVMKELKPFVDSRFTFISKG
jgi:hypothetical protein